MSLKRIAFLVKKSIAWFMPVYPRITIYESEHNRFMVVTRDAVGSHLEETVEGKRNARQSGRAIFDRLTGRIP